MENENREFSRISKIPTTTELRLMYFIEHAYFVVCKHPILNWFITIWFFVFLYLNTIISHLAKEEIGKTNKTALDVIAFIVSLNFINSDKSEVKVSLIFVTLVVFALFIISVLSFSLTVQYCHILLHIFQIFNLYFVPSLFVVFVSVFQHSYIKINNEWTAANYFGIFGHSLFIFIISMTCLFAYISPYIGVHPFFQRSFIKTSVTLFYILIISHLDCYFFKLNSGLKIARIVVSFFMSVFILVTLPYYNRHVNAMFFSFSFFNFLSSLSIQIWPGHHLFVIIYIPVSIVVSIIIFYVILPLYNKQIFSGKDIFFEFFFGRTEKARSLIERLENFDGIRPKSVSNIITIAFNLNSPKILQFLQIYFSGRNLNIGETLHMWIISHLYEAAHGKPTVIFTSVINTDEGRIDHLVQQFWHDAWLSNVEHLSVVSGKLGRKTMNLNMMLIQRNQLLKDVFHDMPDVKQYSIKRWYQQFADDFKVSESQNFKYLFTHFFGVREIALSVLLAFYIVYMFVGQVYLTNLFYDCNAYKELLQFNDEFYRFHLTNEREEKKLFYSFHKAVNSKLIGINKFYTENDFVSRFDDYYDELLKSSSEDDFPVDLFKEFVDKYEFIMKNFLNAFQPFINSTRKKIRIWYYCFLVMVIILSLVPFIISLAILRRNMVNLFEKFRFIPKSDIIKISKINPKLNPFNKHCIKSNYSICKSLPLTLAIIIIYFIVSLMLIFVTYDCSFFSWNSLKSIELAIGGISNIHLIPINLVLSVYWNPINVINKTQIIVNNFLTDQYLYNLISLFPQSFYYLLGSVLFDPNAITSISSDKIYPIVNEINEMIKRNTSLETFSVTYQYQRVCFYIVDMILFVYLVIYINLRIAPIINCEQKMGEFFYQEIKNILAPMSRVSDSESNNLIENELYSIDNNNLDEIDTFFPEKIDSKLNWSIDDIPLILIIIDNSFNIKYQTNLAKIFTGINSNEKFSNSKIDKILLYDIKKAFKKFKKERAEPVSISYQDNQSLVISPFYKNNKLLDYVMIVNSNEPPNASIGTSNKLSRVFYSIYPRILPLNQTFPYEIKSNSRPFFIIFFKLIGFNEWCEKTDLNICQKFRKGVSQFLDNLMFIESYFCYVRETSDVIIMMMNRETKLSIWKILEVCSEFGNNILENFRKLTTEFGIDEILASIMLFKVREPNYYFTSRKGGRTDFRENSIYLGLERLKYCKPEIINYTSQKKELKVSNTTKLKTCFTSNGDEFDLLIVV